MGSLFPYCAKVLKLQRFSPFSIGTKQRLSISFFPPREKLLSNSLVVKGRLPEMSELVLWCIQMNLYGSTTCQVRCSIAVLEESLSPSWRNLFVADVDVGTSPFKLSREDGLDEGRGIQP